jgi:hypothetical protein
MKWQETVQNKPLKMFWTKPSIPGNANGSKSSSYWWVVYFLSRSQSYDHELQRQRYK